MAPSREYLIWDAGGRPYALMRPAAALQRILRKRHGLTVYDYPDESHLRASKPEDHTPFSATGWPLKSAWGIGHALDVMPRSDTAAGRAENAAIARQLIKDRNSGRPEVLWIKYINWTDEKGICRQERWMPNHETRSSTDKGHIHISGRSDCDNDARAEGYDPLAADTAEEGFLMALTDEQQEDIWEWLALLVGPDTPPTGRPGDRFKFPPLVMQAAKTIPVLQAQLTTLTAIVKTLADTIAAGGGNVDTAAILLRMDEAVAEVTAKVEEATAAAVAAGQEARDAVGDFAEGGAEKVREDSDD